MFWENESGLIKHNITNAHSTIWKLCPVNNYLDFILWRNKRGIKSVNTWCCVFCPKIGETIKITKFSHWLRETWSFTSSTTGSPAAPELQSCTDGQTDGGQRMESDNKSVMRAPSLLSSQQPTLPSQPQNTSSQPAMPLTGQSRWAGISKGQAPHCCP